jgi:hypothetical protein
MDPGPLVREEIEAGAELVREFDKYAPVQAAFWLKASDDPYRYLTLASEQFDDASLAMAYGEVSRLTEQMASPYLDPFRVKLIGKESPLAGAAMAIHQRFPGRMATRLAGQSFGGLSVDDVYLYPALVPAAVP